MTRQQALAGLPPADPTLLGEQDTDDDSTDTAEVAGAGDDEEPTGNAVTVVRIEGVHPEVLSKKERSSIRNMLIDYIAARMGYPVSDVSITHG